MRFKYFCSLMGLNVCVSNADNWLDFTLSCFRISDVENIFFLIFFKRLYWKFTCFYDESINKQVLPSIKKVLIFFD